MRKFEKQGSRGLLTRSVILVFAAGLTQSATAQEEPAQNYSVLYSFTGGSDGGVPVGGLIEDSAGNLYGTTWEGGASGDGTIFKFYARRNEAALYSFEGGSDGQGPVAGLVEDAAGNLYGTTTAGGDFNGTVFKIDTQGNETVLYAFTGLADGRRPQAGLVLDAVDNLYGTTFAGGAANFGMVFRVDTSGHETVLHSFTATGGDGAYPYAGLLRDAAGNLYGTTFGGGIYGYGTVFKVAANGDATTLYSFTGAADGAGPIANVISDSAGNFYGTTYMGGSQSVICNGYVGCGTVFRLTASGTESVLYSFKGAEDGANPAAGLIRDAEGNLCGTTQFGGAFGYGTVFSVDRNGKETVLHSFAGSPDGEDPEAGLVRKGGGLYGTTPLGGTYNSGTLFKLVP
jgi:uncharacterized repeat protein (TIGR03803 family)